MKDKIFKSILFIASCLILVLTAGVIYALVTQSISAFSAFGLFNFISSTNWDSVNNDFGALPFITGTLITALLALFFCIPFSLSIALFNGEYFKQTKIATIVSSIVDLLAGIPSIVFGLWGFYVLRPILIDMGVSAQGFGVLLASIVLAIMIIPYASSLSTEFISMVPNELKEAAYSLGATKMEVIKTVSLPVSLSGIFAAYILALGRALGETMAVTMLIGNTNNIPTHISDTGNTMASIIANQFGEADGLKLSSLMAIGLLLFLITATINFIAKYILKLVNK
ncbi:MULTISPECIES: phosphate ABC transporter permease subunit PstC [unclassified Dysgonomonas]|uniref:phosphate ABC transporter permease subunit PstC n=1 Tax=unclassified Dysgonomonas TaxID=2630389 RepID=UPI0006822151|nr:MULTISPECIES: phosphate ABC transporter permease subunit PstC [unclassified Dysgonomonas]MBD8349625.1 phosphate ABC transporter permease subunit PstC [Dysgonomonas sp. HGC4]MBF0577774.1 phosphate ABC transporter permease subunit PstC [Dysgonomonas sp. GY617]